MAYCQNCGGEMADGAKFCPACGTAAGSAGNERKTSYEGEIKKCPNCGAVLSSMQAFCPDCGFELNSKKGSEVVKEFYNGLLQLQSELTALATKSSQSLGGSLMSGIGSQMLGGESPILAQNKKIAAYISAFPVPNTVEDITEFMLLASQNAAPTSNKPSLADTNGENLPSNAWFNKMQQVYTKAKISFGSSPKLQQIEIMYREAVEAVKKAKKKQYRPLIIMGVVGVVCLVMIVGIIIVGSILGALE